MREIILIAHLSLDGFVADANGDLSRFKPGEENLAFVTEIAASADTILSGRITFELLDKYWAAAEKMAGATGAQIAYSRWYNAAAKIVVSDSINDTQGGRIRILNGDIGRQVLELKQSSGKSIVVFGSPTLSRQLMSDDLIDTYWLFFNPLFFGEGIPMFGRGIANLDVELRESKRFPNEELAVKYVRKK